MPDAGIAPACRATSWPALKRTNVGIAWMRKRCARTGSLSVLTLATSQRPAPSPATRASSGATILQGPHQGAQKSAKTGKAERPTRLSKAASWLSSTGSPGGGSSWWQWPQRNVPPSRSKFMRLRVPQCAQLSSNPRSSVSIVSVAVFIKTSHLRSELIHVVPKLNRDTRPSFSRTCRSCRFIHERSPRRPPRAASCREPLPPWPRIVRLGFHPVSTVYAARR